MSELILTDEDRQKMKDLGLTEEEMLTAHRMGVTPERWAEQKKAASTALDNWNADNARAGKSMDQFNSDIKDLRKGES